MLYLFGSLFIPLGSARFEIGMEENLLFNVDMSSCVYCVYGYFIMGVGYYV